MFEYDNAPWGGNVVSMTGAISVAGAGCTARLSAYWLSLCGTGDLPRRSQVDPREIADVLDRVLLLEQIAPGLTRIRLAGQHLSDVMGMDVRGMPLSAFIVPTHRADLRREIEAFFSRPTRLDLSLRLQGRGIFRPAEARLMLLPLLGRDGAMNRAIGCLNVDGIARSATSPQRLEITGIARTSAFPPAIPLVDPQQDPSGRTEAQDGGPARPAHLRLVAG